MATLWKQLRYSTHVMFHPFDGFWDLKHEHRGSTKSATAIVLLLVLNGILSTQFTGFLYNPDYDGVSLNILSEFFTTVGTFMLYCISNWALTTLMDGEGSFKDIFIATSYALAPLPLFLIVSTIASNFVTLEESAIASMLVTVAFVWAGMLIFFGTMVTHDYSFGKNLLMCVATIVGMAVIMFVGFLFSSLIGKMVSFVSSIIMEISYR